MKVKPKAAKTDLPPVIKIAEATAMKQPDRVQLARQRIRAELYHTDAELCRENSTVRDQTARKAQSILDTMTGYFAPMQAAA